MDSSLEGNIRDVPASSSNTERSNHGNEGDSVVEQLLQMAQTLDNRDNTTRDKTCAAAESDHEAMADDPSDKEGGGGGGGDGESRGVDTDEDKDPYEKGDKEGNFKCRCKYFKGNPCYTRYEKEELLAYRGQFKALNKKELDIAILSKIQTGMHLSPMTCQKKRAHTERKMVRSDHYFHGDKICRETFCFIHRISHNKLSVLMAHYRGSGICVRVMKRDVEKAERQKQREQKIKIEKIEKQKQPGKPKSKPQTPQKPRKRKQTAAVKKEKSKKEKQEEASNNITDAGEAVARHIEDMHQFVDIPLSAPTPRASVNKQFMEGARLPEINQQQAHPQQQQQQQIQQHVGVDSNRPADHSAGNLGSHMVQPHHHGVWHLPRRPDMQYHGADGQYMLPQ